MIPALPIDAHLGAIVEVVRRHRAAVIVAPPGSGKTTRVPPALAADGKLILLVPRRLAARALAARIAAERGWRLGGEVGWQMRFDRRFTAETRLLVATEGILTARLSTDPLLSDFKTIVLDEFHERSLHGDLALALGKQALVARDDLRLCVMSATLDAASVARYLGDCPVIEIAGALHPVEVAYAPFLAPETAVAESLARGAAKVLCFLPGAPEIRRLGERLRGEVAAEVLPLHGTLDARAQDAALAPSAARRVILATNIAETSLTIEGVTDVIDTGLHKVLRYDPRIGIDRLETERISLDAATQRTGRAGRTGPGRALRLWDAREELRAHRQPEIERVDLAGPFLEVLAWGGDPEHFDWFETPPGERAAQAMELLERLGAVAAGSRITELGRALHGFPLHPRLARVLLASGGSALGVAACAILSERWFPESSLDTTTCDLVAIADRLASAPWSVRNAVGQLRALARRAAGTEARDLEQALYAGFPDRVARRRSPGDERLVLASGHGAVLDRRSGVRDGSFLLALEVVAGPRGPGAEALVRIASRVEREWLEPTHVEVVHELDEATGAVRATERSWYLALELSRRAVPPDADAACELLVSTLRSRELGEAAQALLRRAAFAGRTIDLEEMLLRLCRGRTKLPEIDLRAVIDPGVLRDLDRSAPEWLPLPNGRRARLDYGADGSVVASVKLQQLFGMAESPRIGPQRVPVTFSLLAPNGRPVQTTRDLQSFWARTYPEVRRELRGRYPKHAWPEDPRAPKAP